MSGLRVMLHRAAAFLVGLLLVVMPWWRHRVVVHRPPYDVHFALHDLILYTSDYVTVALLIVGWSAILAGRPQGRRLRSGPAFILVPFIVLLLLSTVSMLWAVDGLYAGYVSLRLLIGVLLYLLLVNLDLSRIGIAISIAVSISVQAAVGLGQTLLGRSLGLARLGELDLHPAWSGVSVVITESGRHLRAYGLTQHPNLLGGLLVAFLLILAGFLLAAPQQRRGYLSILYLSFGVGGATLAMTFSRGAWLGGAVGAIALTGMLIRARKDSLSHLVGPFCLLTGIALAVSVVFLVTQWSLLRPRLGLAYQGAEVRSVDERATLVAGARALRGLRPWLGVGAGGFSTALYVLAPDSIAAYPIFQPVHNVLLLLATELGPAGSLLWSALMLSPALALLFAADGLRVDGWLAALAAVLVAHFIIGWVEAYPWSSQQGALTTWVTLGLWAHANASQTNQSWRNLDDD